MKTIYKMTIAAVLAATMGSTMATSVPGVSSGIFEFSQSGVASDATIDSGSGYNAISQFNSILDAVQLTGGSNIDNDAFWKASVDPTERNVFEYGKAASMIEELIFTVSGQVYDENYNGGAYATVTQSEIGEWTGSKEGYAGKDSHVTDGKYVDGNLSETKTAATALLSLIGLAVSVDPSTQEVSITPDGSFNGDVSLLAQNGSITTAVNAASIDEQGFKNANALIALIADQLKTGFVLSTENAGTILDAIAVQHTKFLVASLKDEAKKIKPIIKFIAVEEAGVALGMTAAAMCPVDGYSLDNCTAIGKGFRILDNKTPGSATADAATVLTYEKALLAVGGFVQNISDFNMGTAEVLYTDSDVGQTIDGVLVTQTMVDDGDVKTAAVLGFNSFNSTIAAKAITSQFGTITVVEDQNSGSFYKNLKTDAQAEIDSQFALIGDLGSEDLLGAAFTDIFTVDIIRTDASGNESDATETIKSH